MAMVAIAILTILDKRLVARHDFAPHCSVLIWTEHEVNGNKIFLLNQRRYVLEREREDNTIPETT